MVTPDSQTTPITPHRTALETVAEGVIDSTVPLALGSTGFGAIAAPLVPAIAKWALDQWDTIRAQREAANLPVTDGEIEAELLDRAMNLDPADEIAIAEKAKGIVTK